MIHRRRGTGGGESGTNDTQANRLVALLRRPQFAREKLCNLGQFQRVRHIAVDATEFPSSRFDQDKPHWLAALRADRRRGILGHGILTLDQAGALPNSRSPNAAEDGAVILKSYNESLRGCLSGNRLKVFCFDQRVYGSYGSVADLLKGRQCPHARFICEIRLPNVSGMPKILVITKRK